jgi:hypothetical protein
MSNHAGCHDWRDAEPWRAVDLWMVFYRNVVMITEVIGPTTIGLAFGNSLRSTAISLPGRGSDS